MLSDVVSQWLSLWYAVPLEGTAPCGCGFMPPGGLPAGNGEQRMLRLLARQCWRVMLMVAGPLDDGV